MRLLRQSKAEPADQLLYDQYCSCQCNIDNALNALMPDVSVPRTQLPRIPRMCNYGQQIIASAAGACMHVACA